MALPPGAPTTRIEFIDLLRGWAVLVMIETHVVNATLSPEWSTGGFFQGLTFLNGLVAPSFLFASGMAYAVTTHRKISSYLSFSPALFRQLRRIATIGIIGYLLHVPLLPVTRMSDATFDQWQVFFQVDILQCIAASLLLLQVFLLVTRSEKRLYLAAFLTAAAVLVLTPAVWNAHLSGSVTGMLGAYLDGHGSSLFPLFPWLSFLFAGALAGYLFIRLQDTVRFRSSLVWIAGSLFLLSYLASGMGDVLFPDHDPWRAGPSFVLLRLGIVMLVCAFLASGTENGSRVRDAAVLFGRESLFVYVAHLLLIYGDFGPFNLRNAIGSSFGYPGAILLTVGLIGFMFVSARWWAGIKKNSPRTARILVRATAVLVAGILLFGET